MRLDHIDTCECSRCVDYRIADMPTRDEMPDDRSLDQQWADLFEEEVWI